MIPGWILWGFIRKLPHFDLVEAFKSTLEEVKYADLLLHVLDVTSPNGREDGCGGKGPYGSGSCKVPEKSNVYNKIDLMDIAPIDNGRGYIFQPEIKSGWTV